MFPTPDSDDIREGEVLADRVEALAAWLQELDVRLRTAEVATGDEKTAKELRKAIQALAKHDPKLEDRVKNSVDVVNDRLAMLAETVATTSAALAAKDGEIVGLRRALEAGQARLDELAADLRTAPSPVGLDELRKEIAALSARPRATSQHDVDGKIQAVGQRLDMLHETVSTTAAGLASRDGELAALRRQLEEDVHNIADAVAELRIAKDPVHVAELRLTVKELTERASGLEQRTGQALGQVTTGLQEVSARLDSLSDAADRERAASAHELSQALAASAEEREAGLAALRASLEQETGRLDSQVTRVEQALAEASSQLGRLEGLAERDAVEALQERVQDFAEGLDALSGRLTSLSRAVEETGQGADEQAGALSQALTELSQSVDQEKAGFARALSEIRSELRSLAEAGPGEELEARLHDLSGQVEGIGHRLQALDALSNGAREEASGMRAELQQGLEQVGGRLEAVERERAASAEERETIAAGSRLLEERVRGVSESLDALSGRLSSLSRTVEETGQGYEAREQELTALSRRFEDGRAQVDALIADLRSALETMPTPDPALPGRLDDLSRQVTGIGHRLQELDALNAAAETLTQAIGASAEEREALAAGSRLLEEQVQGVSESLDALSGRLSSLSRTVEETGQGYEAREQELTALSRRFEDGRAQVDALIADLRSALETMPTPDPALPGRLDDLSRQVTGIGHRLQELDAMSSVVHEEASGMRAELQQGLEQIGGRLEAADRERAASAHELSQALAASAEEREAGLAALRASLEQETGRLDSQVTRVEQALAEASSQLGRLEGLAERDAVEALQERVQDFAEGLDALSGRLTSLSRAVEETGQGADEQAGALSQALTELSQSVDQEKAGFARALSEIRSELRSLAEAGPGEELEARLHDLSGQVEGIGHRLQALDALSNGAREEASGMRAELQQGLEQVGGRLEAVERERAASAEERETIAAGSRLLEERVRGVSESLDALSGRLSSLSRTVEETGQGYEAREQELTALRTEFDEETGRLDSHVARIEQVVAELTSKLSILETSFGPDPAIVTRLEVLAQAVEAQAAVVASATDGVETGGREIADLRAKAAEGEQRLESVAAGLRGAMDALAVQLDGLAQSVERSSDVRENEDLRLDGLDARVAKAGARMDALAAELRQTVEAASTQVSTAEPSERHDLLERRLDALAADLEARSASKETDLMLGKILLRVDDLARRLEVVEESGGTAAASDLGELEARIEQAEAAARENRESVVVQLERLASRVEYRLDRLESEQPAPASAPAPEGEGSGGRVVPLRGNEA